MTNISFTPDQKTVLIKSLSDLLFATKQLHDWVRDDNLREDMAGALPSLIETNFIKIAKSLNYESYLIKEQEERHKAMRKANQMIRSLETKLASATPIDGLKELVYQLKWKMYTWWKNELLCHLSDFVFTESGNAKMTLKFLIDIHESSFSKNPVTEKQEKGEKLRELIELGLQIEREDKHSHYHYLVDTTNNRSLIEKMLLTQFPSGKVYEYRSIVHEGVFMIQEAEFYIYEPMDIDALNDWSDK
jgi:hypothetical protein